MLRNVFVAAFLAGITLLPPAAMSQERHEPQAKAFIESKIGKWMSNPIVIQGLKEQNAKSAALSQADIDRLDKQWRAETKPAAKPLIDAVLGTPMSAFLKKIKGDSKGLITEIFVMDNRGLNAGQSDVTSDYWQGDEAKWQKTFATGPNAIFVDKVEKDESTQNFQSQISVTITDSSGAAIGAVTIGVDMDELMAF